MIAADYSRWHGVIDLNDTLLLELGAAGVPDRHQVDSLGRPLCDGTAVKVPGEIDVQRARRIVEELRKRVGRIDRSQQELDYIKRLLKDY
jgi:Domain of unknown function (DUF4175)